MNLTRNGALCSARRTLSARGSSAVAAAVAEAGAIHFIPFGREVARLLSAVHLLLKFSARAARKWLLRV